MKLLIEIDGLRQIVVVSSFRYKVFLWKKCRFIEFTLNWAEFRKQIDWKQEFFFYIHFQNEILLHAKKSYVRTKTHHGFPFAIQNISIFFLQSMNFDVFRINFRISIFHYLLLICIRFVAGVLLSTFEMHANQFGLSCLSIKIAMHFCLVVENLRMQLHFKSNVNFKACHFNRHNECAHREKRCINWVEKKNSSIPCIESK